MGLAAAASFLSWASAVAAVTSPAGGEILIEDFASPTHAWTTMNDPVMGGQSSSTFAIEDGVGIFTGEVAIVPFLDAPGFIQMLTTRGQAGVFPDVSSCSALRMNLMATKPYAGYRVSFGTVHLPEGHHASGYKADFEAPDGQYDDVVVPFTAFSAKWNEGTGDQDVSCEEDEQYCPDAGTLQNMETLAIWGEGKEGSVQLNIKSINAVGCSTEAAPSSHEGTEMEEISVSEERAKPLVEQPTDEVATESGSKTPDAPRKASVGIFYASWRGRTEAVAGHLAAATGLEAINIQAGGRTAPPFVEDFRDYDAILVGTPTYNTGACDHRSQTNWDDWLYEVLPTLAISGKKVAVFCTGDQKHYHENFCDAAGELYDKFKEAGCTMMGFTSTDGYSYSWSKAERDGKFIGQMFDEKSQKDLSEGRAKAWVDQLKGEGFFGNESNAFTSDKSVSTEAVHTSMEAAHGMQATTAHTGAAHHSIEKANPAEALDSANLHMENQTGAESNNGSLLMIGAVVGFASFVGSVVHNLVGSKKKSYDEVETTLQGTVSEIM